MQSMTVKANPAAITDVAVIQRFGQRLYADGQALAALMGYEMAVDEAKINNWLDDAGIMSSALRSAYKDIAISRAVFVEGGSRVTDQDVRNQLDIIGGSLKDPEAAVVY